ncbi:MAG TPA: hypothetical protein VGA47_03950 [Candidatus Dormibacteraeota bacterium]
MARRSGADRRRADRRSRESKVGAPRHVAHPLFMGERRHMLRRFDYRRSLFNRRAA